MLLSGAKNAPQSYVSSKLCPIQRIIQIALALFLPALDGSVHLSTISIQISIQSGMKTQKRK